MIKVDARQPQVGDGVVSGQRLSRISHRTKTA
jgi:hypothetical protein